ncbi:DMT family transporter [Neptunomonas qingdaonensis]|uniref:Permease of the drug/metabolite transporter (DMT) superfamily n=1 Tax=Neptunomonas qingdaonensis TaxID=1045558 RepID=A0A1I2T6B6_9GAMM|nr:DMT family transporter [Neptunomonas qingdaonensis]SFG59639.1 Permease of the drug/metabolite transporter (DMT) superfamily [Neptunomonas qingdaonensis]
MSARKDIDGMAIGIITFVSLIWGVQQVFVKAVATDMSPVLQIALRSGIAAFLLAMIMLCRKEKLISRSTYKAGLLAGTLFALEFYFVGEGLRNTSASHMVIFLYSAPIFVALCLHFKITSEQLNSIQWLGIITAFLGIALTFLWRDSQDTSSAATNMLWGDFLALLAAISWASTTVLVRSSSLANAPATQTLFYQLIMCFILVLFAAIAMEQTGYTRTTAVLSNLAFQGIVVSFGSLLLWFWLLRQYSASQLGVFTFMTPLFGIVFSVWLLDEPLEDSFIVGATMVMMGIVMVNGHSRIKRGLKLIFQSEVKS